MKESIFNLIKKFISIRVSKSLNKENLYKKELFYYLKEKSGVYNKFLQVLVITNKFMDGWGSPKEYKVFNQANEEVIDVSDYINIEDFQEYQNKPFAIGSFAQVYKAKLKTGEEVVIKILKPSVAKHLNRDLKSLKKLVRLVSFFMNKSMIDFNKAFEEFSEICLNETDYSKEIANLEYFFELYKNHQYIKIPKVYSEFSQKHTIVQEYINGITLSDILTKENKNIYETCYLETGSDLYMMLAVIGGELLRTAMTKDFIYGDPHPGNIILLQNNKIAFIDFGIVARKPISQRAFYDWTKSYYNILTNDKKETNFYSIINTTCECFCPDFLNALNICTDNKIVHIVTEALTKKLNRIRPEYNEIDSLLENGHMLKIFSEYMNNKNIFKFDIDMRNFPLIKAMQAFICTLSTIDSKFKTNNYTLLMIAAMEYAFASTENEIIPNDYAVTTKYTKGESLEIIDNILSSLAEKDEFIFQNIYKEMF